MNRISIMISAMALLIGCNRDGVSTLASKTSPDGKWVIAAEFDRWQGQGAIVLRNVAGQELDRVKGSSRVDEPSDFYQGPLKMTNDTASVYFREDLVLMWRLDPQTGTWHRVDNPTQKTK